MEFKFTKCKGILGISGKKKRVPKKAISSAENGRITCCQAHQYPAAARPTTHTIPAVTGLLIKQCMCLHSQMMYRSPTKIHHFEGYSNQNNIRANDVRVPHPFVLKGISVFAFLRRKTNSPPRSLARMDWLSLDTVLRAPGLRHGGKGCETLYASGPIGFH